MFLRRRFLQLAGLAAGGPTGLASATPPRDPASAARPLAFPRDFGTHPEASIEWWYATGYLSEAANTAAPAFGFQLTFFRARLPQADALRHHPSRLAAPHLLFAHAALTDLGARSLHHAQRVARWRGPSSERPHPPAMQATDEAQGAGMDDTRVWIEGWRLVRTAETSNRPAVYKAAWADAEIGLSAALSLETTQPVLLQGQNGWSRKSPEVQHASYYYSQPQLAVTGRLRWKGQDREVVGRAWLDHEWSQSLMHPQAQGWDWVGLNLDDGSALTAFRLRRADGTTLWAGGSLRRQVPTRGVSTTRSFATSEVHWIPGRLWRSPSTGATYPVEWTIESPAGRHRVRALVDAQELDSRASTGTVYWEGLSAVEDLGAEGQPRIGWGYLEMTGYAGRLAL